MMKAGIVGFRGYSGEELQQILARHPRVTPVLLEHRADSTAPVEPIGYRGPEKVACTAEAIQAAGVEVAFLATPSDVSMDLAGQLVPAGIKVVDLSGAFRLRTPETHERWYKEPQTQPELLKEAVYSIPELHRAQVAGCRLVSNPGCYPTAASLALAPVVQSGLVDRAAGVVCDAKSGVSGAGRKPSLKTSFCEVTENYSAYSILDHKHVPEVLFNSGLEESEFTFTAQLIPIDRGILETIYFRVPAGTTGEDLVDLYLKAYEGEPFVRVYPAGKVPDLHSVARTNYCDLGVKVDAKTGRAVVVAAIDNLVKGAAGQAVQNMNLMLGFGETEGLL